MACLKFRKRITPSVVLQLPAAIVVTSTVVTVSIRLNYCQTNLHLAVFTNLCGAPSPDLFRAVLFDLLHAVSSDLRCDILPDLVCAPLSQSLPFSFVAQSPPCSFVTQSPP